MASQPLTDARVKRLQPGEKDYVEWDEGNRGFGVRVWPAGVKSPDGKKTFIAVYRMRGEVSPRRYTIGSFPSVGVEEARKEAKLILAKAALGQDPSADRSKQRKVMTMSELCDEYLVQGCGHKKASTTATDKGRIERHIKPLLGKKRINQISKADVRQFLNDVANGKTAADIKTGKFGRAIVTGGKGTATRTLRLLGGIFSYAVDRGYIEMNPRAGVEGFRDKKNTRWLENIELARLGDALREAETDGIPWRQNDGVNAKHRAKIANARETISPHAIAAIRLLLLTGCRLREILHLRWQDVSFEQASLHLPDSKTGVRNVYLSAPALNVLAEIPRIEGNPFVIVGAEKDKPRSDLKRPWARLTEYAGLPNLRLHDLRHSYASVGAASGMGLLFVGKLLGHASTATTEQYAHIANDPLRQANETIGQQIADALLGSKVGDNVTPFPNVGNKS